MYPVCQVNTSDVNKINMVSAYSHKVRSTVSSIFHSQDNPVKCQNNTEMSLLTADILTCLKEDSSYVLICSILNCFLLPQDLNNYKKPYNLVYKLH
jgi:hypothetical protein